MIFVVEPVEQIKHQKVLLFHLFNETRNEKKSKEIETKTTNLLFQQSGCVCWDLSSYHYPHSE